MNDNALCTVMGTFHQFFLNASPTWIFVISLYCYLTVMHDESTARKKWYWLHAYGWGLPFLLTISMFIGQSILDRGPVIGGILPIHGSELVRFLNNQLRNIDGTYDCWIGPAYPDLRLYLYYPTLWMHFILIVVIYIRVLTKIRSVVDALKVITESSHLSTEARPTELPQACHTTNDGKQQSIYNPEHRNSLSVRVTCILPERTNTLSTFNKMMSLKTALIAISYIVSWTPATISRIIQFVPGTKAPYWLTLLAGINFAFSSIWSSLVFFGFLFEGLWRNRHRKQRALSSRM
ncbi:hypothetical protein HDU77_002577 [Chytriomyces hyalinus]|nr:hypothetical protein HDU77_002577 [Chytriomyces hyalinus]